MLTPVEIDRATVPDFLRLRLKDGQERFVASNAITIAQAQFEPNVWLRGLSDGDVAVGLIAMIDTGALIGPPEDWEPANAAYLWRLMIGDAFQGRGYGRAALSLAFDMARLWGRETLTLDVVEAPGSAAPLYRQFGFRPTPVLNDEERFMTAPVPRQ